MSESNPTPSEDVYRAADAAWLAADGGPHARGHAMVDAAYAAGYREGYGKGRDDEAANLDLPAGYAR